jgi:hypothetical protein
MRLAGIGCSLVGLRAFARKTKMRRKRGREREMLAREDCEIELLSEPFGGRFLIGIWSARVFLE